MKRLQRREKTKKGIASLIIFGGLMALVGICNVFSCAGKKEPELTLTEEMAMPIPHTAGRGKPMEELVPKYAEEYVDDPVLKEAVVQFRRWEWTAMYRNLDNIVTENPDYLDAYRLQAEVYMINKNYEAALAQLDRILERDSCDVHALGVSAILMRILGNEAGEIERMQALEMVSKEAAEDVRTLLDKTEALLAAPYSSQPQTDMVPDAIVVFGQTPKANGQPSAGLLSRLEKTKEMAERFPNAKLILSGGDVKTQFTEASVMRNWLVEQGIDERRILLDELARDTYGNAIGSVELCEKIDAHNILVIGTILHLPRAVTTLTLYSEFVGYNMEIDSAGGGEQEIVDEDEQLYTYVNASRAAGLFSKQDYERFN